MRLSRPSRVAAALIALFSMLFMQLAVAAYACPGLSMGQGVPAPEMAAHSSDPGVTPCSEMDMEQPTLCHASEHVGYQSLDKPQLPHVAPFVPAALVVVWHTVDSTLRPTTEWPQSVSLERSTAPPVAIRNCCFRI